MGFRVIIASVGFLVIGLLIGAVLERQFPTVIDEYGSLLVLLLTVIVLIAAIVERLCA